MTDQECYRYVSDFRRSHNTTTSPVTTGLDFSQSSHPYYHIVTSEKMSSPTSVKPLNKDNNPNTGTDSNAS